MRVINFRSLQQLYRYTGVYMYLLYRYASPMYRYTGIAHTCTLVPVWLYTCTPVHLHACALLSQYAATVQVYRCVYVLVIQVCQPGVPVYRYCTYLYTCIPVYLYGCIPVHLYTCTRACVCCVFAVCSNCTGIQECVRTCYTGMP